MVECYWPRCTRIAPAAKNLHPTFTTPKKKYNQNWENISVCAMTSLIPSDATHPQRPGTQQQHQRKGGQKQLNDHSSPDLASEVDFCLALDGEEDFLDGFLPCHQLKMARFPFFSVFAAVCITLPVRAPISVPSLATEPFHVFTTGFFSCKI